MNLSVAQIYFLAIFGVHFYAYYLFNQIGDAYEKSEERCERLSEYGFELGTMILNTMMFISNLFASKAIIEYMNVLRVYRVNQTYPRTCDTNKIEHIGFITFIIFLINLIPSIIIPIMIGQPCFRNKFTLLYHRYVLMTCMLSITTGLNAVLCLCVGFIACDYDAKMFYKLSDMYKKISSNYKTFFSIGIGLLHIASLYLFDDKSYTDETKNYINAIFWTGHFIDGLNLIVLFYDDYADIIMSIMTTLSFVNGLIIGIILGLGSDVLSLQTVGSLMMANVFVGLWTSYFVSLGLVYGSIGIVVIFSYTIVTAPLVFWGLGCVCIGFLWVVNFFGGCELETRDDGHYFKNLFDGCYDKMKPYMSFANAIIKSYIGFTNRLFEMGHGVIGTTNVGTTNVVVVSQECVKETNTV